jgi:hypothetical protein
LNTISSRLTSNCNPPDLSLSKSLGLQV